MEEELQRAEGVRSQKRKTMIKESGAIPRHHTRRRNAWRGERVVNGLKSFEVTARAGHVTVRVAHGERCGSRAHSIVRVVQEVQ